MPLYEIIVATKVSENKALASMLKSIVQFNVDKSKTAVIRNVVNLGERITSKGYTDKVTKKQMDFCRFLKFHVDSDPHHLQEITSFIGSLNEVLGYYHHRVKNEEVYKGLVDKEYFKKFSTFEVPQEEKADFIAKTSAWEIAKRINKKRLLKENKENTLGGISLNELNNENLINDKGEVGIDMKFDIKKFVEKKERNKMI